MWVYPPDVEDEARPRKCRGCGAEIIWAITKVNAKVPLNPGYKILTTQALKNFSGKNIELIEVANEASHFATCPNAQKFRKRKK